MIKKFNLRGIALSILLLSCQSAKNNDAKISTAAGQDTPATAAVTAASVTTPHKVTVLEVIQVEKYTYLKVKENDATYWMAVPTIDVKAGDQVYYEHGMEMTNFESRELKRTFEKILFVDKVSKEGNATVATTGAGTNLPANHPAVVEPTKTAPAGNQGMGSSRDSIKRDIKIEPARNGVSIASLLANASSYKEKPAIVRGKVTKFTGGVMGKNWIHIQDGTTYKGKFEIVITTDAEAHVGDVLSFEGPVTLNKDFGYGYFFEVLMENAKLVN